MKAGASRTGEDAGMELKLAIAFWRLGRLTGDALAAAAGDALAAGHDSPSLRVLAGEVRPPLSDAEPLFARSLRELSFVVPGEHEAALCVARHYAAEIVAGRLTPYEGASRIWGEVYGADGSLSELSPFVALADEYEYCEAEAEASGDRYGRRRAEVEADIVEEAKRLLEESERAGR